MPTTQGECNADDWFYSHYLRAVVEVTFHARERMGERGISYLQIEQTLLYGLQPPGTNRRCYRGITVAVKQEGNIYLILTVWPN